MNAEQEPERPSLDDVLWRFVREIDTEGFPVAGAIPEGHEGPYEPSAEELEKAIEASLEASVRLAQARADLARDLLRRSREEAGPE